MPSVKLRPKPKPKSKPRKSAPLFATLGELLERLGGISAHRVCADPPPGTVTLRDFARRDGRSASGTLCELVDGTFVEKPMGSPESVIATEIIGRLWVYLAANPVGFMGGEGYFVQLARGLVRLPDVCVTLWEVRPDRSVSSDKIAKDIPALVVEVLSESNTKAEMARKLTDYFAAGVKVAWIVDPENRRGAIHTTPNDKVTLDETGVLTAESVLPGFAVPLSALFTWLSKPAAKKRKPKPPTAP